MQPEPLLHHDLRNKLWIALEAINFYLAGQKDVAILKKAKNALELSLSFLNETPEKTGYKSYDLNKATKYAIDDIKLYAKKRKINLSFYPFKNSIRITSQLDKVSLYRIIQNLVMNAIEAASSEVKVCVGFYSNDYGSSVCPAVIIQDDGNGISREEISFIFLQNYSSRGTNRGRGLYIVNSLLKEKGALKVFTSSAGSLFTVIFEQEA